jgi:hypothetical protein
MIYLFKFIQKPFSTEMMGQVECDHFNKWFMENTPYGCRLVGKPEQILEKLGGGK